jgi:hypothetical protein
MNAILIPAVYASPYYPFSTAGESTPSRGDCSSSYPGLCIASQPPDLDCIDVFPSRDFIVLAPDPHNFDSDSDGRGCEIGENA